MATYTAQLLAGDGDPNDDGILPQASTPYFAYGSNLNQADWTRWCTEHHVDPSCLQALGNGWLVDHRPIYHYRSVTRGGGALDVIPAVGHLTPGTLFRVSAPGWSALDAKEGAPGAYERTSVQVLSETGTWQSARTYRVAAHRRGDFTPPTREYAAIVRQGLLDRDLPCDQHEAALLGEVPRPRVRHLFVYGLLQSHAPGGGLPVAGVCRREPARIQGRLFDLGAYPGWQPSEEPAEAVHGQLLELACPATTLTLTDQIEGCADYSAQALYHRVLVRAMRANGGGELAWCYRLADRGLAPRIPTGRWPCTASDSAVWLPGRTGAASP